MTSYALTAGAAVFVVGVFLQRRSVRTIRRRWPMTVEAELVYGLSELSVVFCAVHVMAGSAGNTVLIHDALHKVVALHPVLMRGSVWEVRECCLTQGDVIEFPEVLQMKTDVVADRPVVSFALDLFGKRLPL